MLKIEPPAIVRGRPKARFIEVVKEDMQVVGVTYKEVEVRGRWRQMTRCGDL